MSEDEHIFENLYYKENQKVGVLRNQVEYLKAQIVYLNTRIAYFKRYPKDLLPQAERINNE